MIFPEEKKTMAQVTITDCTFEEIGENIEIAGTFEGQFSETETRLDLGYRAELEVQCQPVAEKTTYSAWDIGAIGNTTVKVSHSLGIVKPSDQVKSFAAVIPKRPRSWDRPLGHLEPSEK